MLAWQCWHGTLSVGAASVAPVRHVGCSGQVHRSGCRCCLGGCARLRVRVYVVRNLPPHKHMCTLWQTHTCRCTSGCCWGPRLCGSQRMPLPLMTLSCNQALTPSICYAAARAASYCSAIVQTAVPSFPASGSPYGRAKSVSCVAKVVMLFCLSFSADWVRKFSLFLLWGYSMLLPKSVLTACRVCALHVHC
jgi:hypothetical protein